MCNYLSFCGDLNGEQFWFEPMLSSHLATADLHSLKPDTYREYEWTDDDETSLSVRVHPDDPHGEAWMRACVLAKWPTRKALEEWLIVNVPQSRIRNRFAQGGDDSTLTGGDDSTLTGGHGSTLTGGDRSTLTGGDDSTLTGGRGSTLTGGDRSTLTGGNRSVFALWEYRDDKYNRHVAIVGQEGIKPDVPYRIVDGKWTEVPQPKKAGK